MFFVWWVVGFPLLMIGMCFQVCGSLQPGHLAVRGTGPRDQAPADQRRPQRDLCHSEGPSWLCPRRSIHPASCDLVGGAKRKGHVSSARWMQPPPFIRGQTLPGARWLFERHPVGLGPKAMNLSQSAR